MAKATVVPQVRKTVFEVRYKPALKFHRLLQLAGESLPDFDHWARSPLALDLRNFRQRCDIQIQFNRAAYDQDSDDEAVLDIRVGQILDILCPALEVNKVIRVGFRQHLLADVHMAFDSLVTVFDVKLLGQDPELRRMLPGKVADVAYVMDLKEGPINFHVSVGPVKKDEIPQRVLFNVGAHLDPETKDADYKDVLVSYPGVGLFIDLDVYTEEELEIGSVADFVTKAKKRIGAFSQQLASYMFQT